MDPKDFGWAEDQQVTVTNPTDKAYPFKVHSKEYEVKAGETVRMPGYIAWVYVYGITSQMCQAAGEFNRWNEEGFKQTYFTMVVVGADDVIEKVVVEPKVEPLEAEEEEEEATGGKKQPRQRRGRTPANS
jgi:hypothetical protein